jgi:hypothetical protein
MGEVPWNRTAFRTFDFEGRRAGLICEVRSSSPLGVIGVDTV